VRVHAAGAQARREREPARLGANDHYALAEREAARGKALERRYDVGFVLVELNRVVAEFPHAAP
jgi:hypothetical protein